MKPKQYRRVKIVATIGPACNEPATAAPLLEAGVDVARINFSHENLDSAGQLADMLRRQAQRLGRPLALMGDLPGPKLRIGDMGGQGLQLKPGSRVTLLPGRNKANNGAQQAVPVPIKGIGSQLKKRDLIYLDDGLIRLRALKIETDRIICEVLDGGRLTSHKGIAFPGPLDVPTIGKRDRLAIRKSVEIGLDLLAASFVRSAADVLQARRIAVRAGKRLPIYAKLERPEAIDNLESIIQAADGVMVARGDLGISMPIEQVPMLQKRIIQAANRAGKPCITATQMLESMKASPIPTRAEVSDVANAILDGTDAVMLSAETAMGRFPVRVVQTMDRVARETETTTLESDQICSPHIESAAAAVGHSACQAALDINAAWIVAFTRTGASARLISSLRPRTPICALTPDPAVYRGLAIHWGVTPILIEPFKDLHGVHQTASQTLKQNRLARKGQKIVLVYGRRLGEPGSTDTMVVDKVQ